MMCMSEKERLTVKIDSKVKQELKVIALRKELTMSQIIEDEISKFVKENSEYL